MQNQAKITNQHKTLMFKMIVEKIYEVKQTFGSIFCFITAGAQDMRQTKHRTKQSTKHSFIHIYSYLGLDIVFLIQLSCFAESNVYTPGNCASPHRRPKDVTPTSSPPHSRGPPESPCGQRSRRVISTSATETDGLEASLPGRYRHCRYRQPPHTPSRW